MMETSGPLTVTGLGVDVFDECIAARRRIVSDVSFTLPVGQGLGITGESGSGKTTLSLALSGLLPAGSRIVADHRNARATASLSAVSVAFNHLEKPSHAARGHHVFTLFQEPRASLNPYRTIGWQLKRCQLRSAHVSGTEPKWKASQTAADDALRSVGLEPDVSRHYPHELSTGMCQRVFLAMANLLGSSILVADEPFASVDSETQRRLAALVSDWMQTRRITLILVSHDLDLLRELTQQTLVMYRGQVAESGPTAQVLSGDRTGHPYTWLLREVSNATHQQSIKVHFPHATAPVACCFAARCAWADATTCTEPVPASRTTGDSSPGELEWRIRCVRHPDSEAPRSYVTEDAAPLAHERHAEHEILRVEHVAKEFVTGWFRPNARRVLDDVSFSLAAGERLGIVGSSGQGKTTLARIILGLLAPTEGQVELAIGDRRMVPSRLRSQDRTRFRRHIQMVYQDTDLVLDPGERIGDALVEAYRVFDTRLDAAAAYRHAARLLVELALPEGLLEAYPYRLSGGERKRVALARSLAAFGCPFAAPPQNPWRILILDEPTAGIDSFLQAILCRFLLWVHERLHVSYLVISHDEGFVRKFCHRTMRLQGGQISWETSHGNSQLQ